METHEKPRIRYSDVAPESKTKKIGRVTQESSEGLGYLLAIGLPWIVSDVLGYSVPMELLSAFSALVAGEAVRIRERLFR